MVSGELNPEVTQYVGRTIRSKQMQEEAAHYLPGGSTRGGASYFGPHPLFIDHAKGHYVYDVDEHQYLDFNLNGTTFILGHANPIVLQAVHEQTDKGLSYSGPTKAQTELARIICEKVPSVDSLRFVNSGTEATLNAIRAARAFTGKHKFAKFEGGYHGSHEYASISVHPPAEKLDPNGPTAIPEHPGQPPSVAEDVVVLPFNDIETCNRIIMQNKEQLACVIMEPVASVYGFLPANPSFLQTMRDLTSEMGILLIFDEVHSFRLSEGGAQTYFGVIPDMTTLGKMIGGGMPVGAFGGREDIMALYDPSRVGGPIIPHAGTFNGNPMTMVAGEATLKQLTPEVYKRLNHLGDNLRGKLGAVLDELEIASHVTGIGSLFGIHFTSEKIADYRTMLRGDQEMKSALFTGLLNEGILLQNRATGALCTLTTESEIDDLVNATRRVLERLKKR